MTPEAPPLVTVKGRPAEGGRAALRDSIALASGTKKTGGRWRVLLESGLEVMPYMRAVRITSVSNDKLRSAGIDVEAAPLVVPQYLEKPSASRAGLRRLASNTVSFSVSSSSNTQRKPVVLGQRL